MPCFIVRVLITPFDELPLSRRWLLSRVRFAHVDRVTDEEAGEVGLGILRGLYGTCEAKLLTVDLEHDERAHYPIPPKDAFVPPKPKPPKPRWYDGRLWVLESGSGRVAFTRTALSVMTNAPFSRRAGNKLIRGVPTNCATKVVAGRS